MVFDLLLGLSCCTVVEKQATDSPPSKETAGSKETLTSGELGKSCELSFGDGGGMVSTKSMKTRTVSKRRGSQFSKDTPAERPGSKDQPAERRRSKELRAPEKTPEPLSPVNGRCLAKVADVLAAAGSMEGLVAGVACDVCLCGESLPSKIDVEFREKRCDALGGDDAPVRARLEKEGIVLTCRKGKKPEQPNQDNYFFAETQRFRVCGVADGHGEHGHWASHWVVRFVLRALLMELAQAEGLPEDAAIVGIFELAHEAVKRKAPTERFDLHLSGTTLSVAVVDMKTQQALIAWAGDSRCVCGAAAAGGRPGGPTVLAESSDHKPQDPEERRRIVGSGGEVVKLPNDVPHRVFVRDHGAPGLAMSRALGDLLAHSVGVTHTPGIRRFLLAEGSCLLCCSDGVWEFIKSSDAVAGVLKAGPQGAAEAARVLVEDARRRWLRESADVTDDITAVVVWGCAKLADSR